MKLWLSDNDIEMCSTHNESKSVVPKKIIRTLKNKIYEYMTSILKNLYIDSWAHMVNEYNNTYHKTIKMKPVDVTSSTYIEFGVENHEKVPKFNV